METSGTMIQVGWCTQHPPSCLTTKLPRSEVFDLHFEIWGQDADVVQRNRSLPHEINACCANKHRITIHLWQDIFG